VLVVSGIRSKQADVGEVRVGGAQLVEQLCAQSGEGHGRIGGSNRDKCKTEAELPEAHASESRSVNAVAPPTLVVIPTYNERESLPILLEQLLEVSPPLSILVVDDNSPDGTGLFADELAAREPRIAVLHRTEKEGLGPAYVAGFGWALEREFSIIVEMDADGSHLVEELPSLIAAVQNGAALAIGSRWVKGGTIVNWPRYRQAISRAGTAYARVLLRSQLHDITSGFRAFSRAALESVDLSSLGAAGYVFQIELAWRIERQGLPIREVPITFVERAHGSSKMTTRIVVEALGKVTLWGLRGPNRVPH